MPPYAGGQIAEISQSQSNCVVVLHNGSPVEMPWIGGAKV